MREKEREGRKRSGGTLMVILQRDLLLILIGKLHEWKEREREREKWNED